MDRSFLDVVANDRILLIRETKTVDRSIRPAVKDSNGHPNDSRQHVADLIILTESRDYGLRSRVRLQRLSHLALILTCLNPFHVEFDDSGIRAIPMLIGPMMIAQ